MKFILQRNRNAMYYNPILNLIKTEKVLFRRTQLCSDDPACKALEWQLWLLDGEGHTIEKAYIGYEFIRHEHLDAEVIEVESLDDFLSLLRNLMSSDIRMEPPIEWQYWRIVVRGADDES